MRDFQVKSEWWTDALKLLEEGPAKESPFVIPETGTASAQAFFIDLINLNRIPLLFMNTCIFADNAAYTAGQIQRKLSDPDFKITTVAPLEINRHGENKFSKSFAQVYRTLYSMTFARLVDNMSSYISSVIRECLKSKPELLKSKETITFEFALGCGTIEELREIIMDRKVDELAYLGFDKLSEWIADRLGISNFDKLPFYQNLIECIEIRNSIVHNHTRVSHKYMKRFQGMADIQLNETIEVEVEMVYGLSRASSEYVRELDKALSSKFSLPVGKIK